ncbi:hypothetical protein [Macrococcus lamae]|uniref:Lipoprotein n=1 Tax=Macrococcus lamae TaxID=198484 RepID=A0A4V3BES9_9STAP|nr:hypothetical protein [Macrococcus lamae]TDM07496.1 hypothetical protein ERX29_08660 [Macrococcus lamae]
MKTFVYIIIILSLIMSACSNESPKPRTKDETLSQMQTSIKAIDSLSSDSENQTTVIYNKFTTRFTQMTNSQTSSDNTVNLSVEADSNHSRYPVKSYQAYVRNGALKANPVPTYITYQARRADTKYIETAVADIFNLNRILQGVVKPVADKVTIDKDSIKYTGNNQVLKELFEYGLSSSSLNQVEALSDLTDLKVAAGEYTVNYSPAKVYPKTLSFKVEMTATIDEEPVRIQMEQTTNYSDFNKTTVTDPTE